MAGWKFLKEIEKIDRRPPTDMDIVTFFTPPTPTFVASLFANSRPLIDVNTVKSSYHIDHYFVDMSIKPEEIVYLSRYWHNLFTHRRNGVWKGILRVDLGTFAADNEARQFLNSSK